ncbi:hypothetical protein [Burkholderia cepacia]|uniref:hypothetical protein n=2 Tax=Burkholderia cepacia TaxID=292 RepID=UPI000F56E18D|nr:hypothetical protein DF023_24580 [Burkholderia cepacia]RQU04750.1 hypothetical protein DF022_13425 [Burkholderia cepacia]RQZ77621.1 hypothetical protein DF056_24745 [Burkholderia cepacia]
MSVMKHTRHWVLGVLAVFCCTSSMAAGILKLSRAELTLTPDKPPGELWAENVGDSPLYLDVTQQLVTNPGQSPECLVPVTDVPQPALLVVPGRLVLAPGQKYQVMLKELATPAQAQVWRVTFRPRELLVVDTGSASGTQAPLVVSIGYGVVVYQLARRMPPQ